MPSANERQVGGEHYKGAEYQHWDWVTDTKLNYLAGCASKYVSRHRSKNGKEDLGKAIHYMDKAQERFITGSAVSSRMSAYWRFVLENNLTMIEAMICWYVQEGEWEAARLATQTLLDQTA